MICQPILTTEVFLWWNSNWLALPENKHYLLIQANTKETTLQQSQQSFHLWKMQVILKMKEYLLEIHTLEYVIICVWGLHEVTAGNLLLRIFCSVLSIDISILFFKLNQKDFRSRLFKNASTKDFFLGSFTMQEASHFPGCCTTC